MKKRLISLCLAAAMICGTFSACSGGDSGKSGSDAGSKSESTSEGGSSGKADEGKTDDAGGGDKVTLTFMGWEASPLETQAVKDGITNFESQNPNVTISYTPSLSGAEYTAKLLSSHAGGSMPDVMFMQAADYRTFASKGVISELTDKFGGEFTLDDFLPAAQEEMSIDGKVYGIQSCLVTPVLYYNKDILDAAGVEYPGTTSMTWEEFREKAIALTNDEIYGAYGAEATGAVLYGLLATNDASLFNEDYTKSAINTPEAKEAFEAIRSLRYDDKAALDATTLENIGMSAYQMLQTGKVAMVLDGSWALQELSQMDFELGVAPIPAFKDSTNVGQAHLHCIAAQCENQNEAWEFLKFLSGMDYQGELVKRGLWMPNRVSMYEPEVVEEWYSEDVHHEYIDFLDYFKDANVQPDAMQKSTKCSDIMTEETDKFFKDGGSADDMLANIESRSNEAIEEAMGG